MTDGTGGGSAGAAGSHTTGAAGSPQGGSGGSDTSRGGTGVIATGGAGAGGSGSGTAGSAGGAAGGPTGTAGTAGTAPGGRGGGAGAGSAGRGGSGAGGAGRGGSAGTGTAGTGAAGTGTAGSGSAGTGAGGSTATIPMFVAQGAVGRTTISCDDGLTWVANRSDDDALRCYSQGSEPDCDHGPTAARGMTSGGGWFFASFGWGEPGSLRRSRDGVVWEPVLTKNQQGAIAFGLGRVLGSDNYSDNLGVTWKKTSGAGVGVTRDVGFIPQAGGHFVVMGDDGAVVSTDTGWTKVTTGCGSNLFTGSGVAASPTVSLVVNQSGTACRTTDGGMTWKSASVGGSITSHPIWDGTVFRVWGRGKVYTSPDGATWASAGTTPSSLQMEAVAFNPTTGTFVGEREEWREWYDQQVFYRSKDGVKFDTLPKSSYVPSHRIIDITFDYGAPSSVCPGK